MSDIAQDLGGVVRLLVPEPKPLPDLLLATYHEARGWNACRDAMLKLTSTHSAEIAVALRDAERYRWLLMMAKEQLLNPKAAGSEWPDMRTYWRIPTLICSGPVGGFIDFDAAIDAAMQQGGGGG